MVSFHIPGPRQSFNLLPIAEHYMMYHKALCMGDREVARQILDNAATPAEANALGKKVKSFDKDLWNRKQDEVVERGNWLKFSQVDECRKALLDTGDRVLVEAHPADRECGIGFEYEDAEGREEKWGENRLRKALMKVRERSRKENL